MPSASTSSTSAGPLAIEVEGPRGSCLRIAFDRPLLVGRCPPAELVLEDAMVSKRHARLRPDGPRGAQVEDLGSRNGLRVGDRTGGGAWGLNESLLIGPYRLRLTAGAKGQPALPAVAAGGVNPRDALRAAHDALIEALDLRRLPLNELHGTALRQRAETEGRDIVERMGREGRLPQASSRDEFLSDLLHEALGLGPLELYLADESIDEVMVNGPDQIFVERKGRLERVQKGFSSARAVLGVIERIVAPLGRHIDESSPMVDARLPDGSRVNAIVPPLSLTGPCITIRKFRKERLEPSDLVRFGSLSEAMAAFLQLAVEARLNILISGGTGSGKTTLLNCLAGFIPRGERIVTIEDAAELQLPQEHWVQLEARPANLEGKGQVPIRELLRNALRMRPDRIVVGECRGGEALDMLQAMNTGHDGSLTTLHANTPRDAVSRLETLVLMSGMDLPVRAIREQIGSSVHLLVQQARFADGSRRVTSISEVTGMEEETLCLQEIFSFRQEGFGEDGRVRGRYAPSGFIPRFYDERRKRGLKVDLSLFRGAQ